MADKQNRPGAFRLKDLPDVDPDKLSRTEVERIEAAVAERDAVLTRVRTDLVDLTAERDALRTRLSKVEQERQELRDRLDQIEQARTDLEPRNLVRDFGEALRDTGGELEGTGFAVRDYEVELKTNVVHTDRGLRLHLPGLAEEFAAENLSTIRFRMKQRPTEEHEYVEIPDLRGLPERDAARRLRDADLTVGDREVVETGTPGTVQDQYPEPYALAPPGTEIDLTVSGSPEEEETRRAIEEKRVERVERPAEEEKTSGDEESGEETSGDSPETRAAEPGPEESRASTTVPRVLGTDLKEARAAVRDAGLKIGALFERPGDADPGTVTVQDPDPGEQVEPGTAMDIAVTPYKTVATPDLLGLRRPAAEKTLRDRGLEPRVEIEKTDTRRTKRAVNTVTKQDPEPGAEAEPGDTVTITVHSPPPVDRVRDIGKRRKKRLADAGVETVDDLATALPENLSSALGSAPVARRIVETAKRYRDAYDLTRIPGLGVAEAEALAEAGVTNRQALADADPEELHATLKTSLGKDSPDFREIKRWVTQGKRSR